jgi:hypothetical protein
MRNQLSWRPEVAIVSPKVAPSRVGALHARRSAVAQRESEDAQITGMTRSLDRRLLALNLKPVASVGTVLGSLRVA